MTQQETEKPTLPLKSGASAPLLAARDMSALISGKTCTLMSTPCIPV